MKSFVSERNDVISFISTTSVFLQVNNQLGYSGCLPYCFFPLGRCNIVDRLQENGKLSPHGKHELRRCNFRESQEERSGTVMFTQGFSYVAHSFRNREVKAAHDLQQFLRSLSLSVFEKCIHNSIRPSYIL